MQISKNINKIIQKIKPNNNQKFPFLINIYKGEGRILINPCVQCWGGYRIPSENFTVINNMEDYKTIGKNILNSLNFIKNSPIDKSSAKEREDRAVWKINTKYKTWISFWKNNNHCDITLYEDKHYEISSYKKSKKFNYGYDGCIKKITLTKKTTAEEIGKAIIDVFKAVEDYYKVNPFYDDKVYQIQTIELLNGMNLIVQEPKDEHFINSEDYGVAEIYQGYSYVTGENEKSSAELFIGIASELDCNLGIENVKNIWEEQNGRADFFELKSVNFGIFNIRAEFKNEKVHKTSYLLQMEDDLLLECGMEVYIPNKRKKLDEKLTKIFVEFSLNCKIKD